MPIDLKWVRSDPDQVRQWQKLRRRGASTTAKGDDNCVGCDNVASIDLVDAVLRKDELSRKNLQNLQELKKSLKQLQMRLRPSAKRQPVVKKNDVSSDEKKPIQKEDRQDNQGGNQKSEPLSQSSSNREYLLKEKKAMETKIKSAEADWKASLDDTYKTLCKLVSPVTIMEANGDGVDCNDITGTDHDLGATTLVVPPPLLPESGYSVSSLGMDLEQAWRQYTLRHFAAYLWVEVPGGVPVTGISSGASRSPWLSNFSSIDIDRAHELWGPICGVSSDTSSSNANNQPVVMLPSWVSLLTESLPNKSIWGEKELPSYSALWSRNENKKTLQQGSDHVLRLGRPKECNEFQTREQYSSGSLPGSDSISGPFSLELVALSAPSAVDAREIQNDLVNELLNYYSGLVVVGGDERSRKKLLKRVVVPAANLHNHEWSRVEIHFQLGSSSFSESDSEKEDERNSDAQSRTDSNINTLRLGWVSHWGDAATRACDMAFAGGGVVRAGGKKKSNKSARNAATKEYVHLVEASVIDNSPSTWNKILYANSNAIVNSDNFTDDGHLLRRKEKQTLVGVPPALVPYLIRPIPNSSTIPLEDLFLDQKSKRKKETVFGPRDSTRYSSVDHNQQQDPDVSRNSSAMMKVGEASSRTQAEPRFPPFGVTCSVSPEELHKRKRFEKLSCPYDFLFE